MTTRQTVSAPAFAANLLYPSGPARSGGFKVGAISIAILAMIAWAGGSLHAQNLPVVPSAAPQTTTTTTTTVQTTGPAAAARPGGPVTLNFNNAEIDAVARTIAVITGKNVVVDPRVKGTMTLVTATAVTPALALRQFSTQLRTQGFALVESSGLYLVVPEADAKLQSGAVFANTRPAPSGQIITQIFRLNYETANNLVPVLRPLISPNNTINVNPGNNSLIITDYADNLQRMGTIIAALDVVNATGVEIIRLQHAIATDLAPLVNRLIESGGAAGAAVGQTDSSFKTTLVAEPRSNSLILRAANPARLSLVRTLVEKLDQASSIGAAGSAGASSAMGNIYVVYLKNADSTKLAATLRAAIAAGSVAGAGAGGGISSSPAPAAGAGGGAGGVGGVSAAATGSLSNNQPSTGGQIQADPATNSLIITAPEPQYRQLRAVIDKLDSRRAQVFIESLIAEVNTDKAAEFGVQFQSLLGTGAVLGTNFATGGANIFSVAASIAAGTPAASTGLNFAGVAQRNGQSVLGFLARFIETSGDGNILSTPNLLTLDNEEARIVIGQNVPFVTGSFTNTGSNNGSVNPFQTVERKDVGLTLRVKPQISEDGQVKLQIFQESSSIQANSINSTTGLITNKRSIESNVVVNDGSIVVLGGLLQDTYQGGQEKVPGLGNLPVLGNLFRAETRSRSKTNLMIFLRPVVIRDGASSDSLSLDRYESMRSAQKDIQPVPSTTVPINSAPVLPPQRAPGAPVASPPPLNTMPLPPPPPALAVPSVVQ